MDGSDSSRRSGRRSMSNPLYAHAYSSFRQQDREHRHPPAASGEYSRQGWDGAATGGGGVGVGIGRGQGQQFGGGQCQHGGEGHGGWNGGQQGRESVNGGRDTRCSRSLLIPYPDRSSTYEDGTPTAASVQRHEAQRKRVRSVLLAAALSFAGLVVLDGLVRLSPDFGSGVEERAAELERRLVDGAGANVRNKESTPGGGLLRRLMESLLDDSPSAPAPPHRSYSEDGLRGGSLTSEGASSRTPPRETSDERGRYGDLPFRLMSDSDLEDAAGDSADPEDDLRGDVSFRPPRGLHTLPIIPRHALKHRQRRELIERRMPIPEHLRDDVEDEMYHAHNARGRRRMYPVLHDKGEEIIDARHLQQEVHVDSNTTNYETGALYQGYGTHYLDLWVGTPPQRQTVIIDTGSSITAFPCSGCDSCGTNPTTGVQYHLDDEFDTAKSRTYHEKECERGHPARIVNGKRVSDPGVPCDLGTCAAPVGHTGRCQLAVSYAEGSTWTASEGSDVAYPAGPHEIALETRRERLENGVGKGMGNYYLDDVVEDMKKEEDEAVRRGTFDWMDFRLRFGCQRKVTSLFRTQLEDGIMGMDNRKGAFWLQLHQHYKKKGYKPDRSDKGQVSDFDPAQFSLCYDRQPLSADLRPGVGSGALTLGGTDPLLHDTDMVFAENVTPVGGWYNVRIKAMFLRANWGASSGPLSPAEYVRVNSREDELNGSSNKARGVILDSGTTDTYLPAALKGPFERAWKEALGDDAKYDNNPREMTIEEVKSLPTILVVLKGHGASNKDKGGAVGMTGSHEAMLGKHEPDLESVSKSDVVVAVPPGHYMEESHREPGRYTARIYFTERYGAQSILGSNFLMGHEVLFDNGRGRIGFAESHCDYDRYVKERDAREGGLALVEGDDEGGATSRVASREEEAGNAAEGDEAQHGIGGDLAASGWALRR